MKAAYLQLCVFEVHFKVAVADVYRALIVRCQVTAGSLSRCHTSLPMRMFRVQVCAAFLTVCIIDAFDCSKPCVPLFYNLPISHLVASTDGSQADDAPLCTSGV